MFLVALAHTKPAILIKLADSRDNLKGGLFSFTSAWIDKGGFPMTLKPHFSSLLQMVASGASDLDVWTVVAQLLIAFDPPNIEKVPFHTSAILNDLRRDWNSHYFPHSLDALRSLVRQYQQFPVEKYYARTLVFVQSSGTGKSRLVD